MNNEVIQETLLLTQEDKKLLSKNTVVSILLVIVFEVIAGFILLKLIDDADFKIVRLVMFGFFILVGLIIIFTNVSSLLDKNKVVSTGYVTDKRIHTRYSRSKGGSSSSIDYYITLGEKEMSIMLNYYNMVSKGDKIKIHQTKWNKSIFKIEILESTKTIADQQTEQKAYSTKQLADTTEYLAKHEKTFIMGKLFKALFFRGIVLGAVAYGLYYVFIIVLIMSMPSKLFLEYKIITLNAPIVLASLFYLAVNLKTIKIFLDLMNDQKTISTQIITDVIRNNKPMSGKNMIITSGTPGDYYYASTNTGLFIEIGSLFGGNAINGDRIIIHTAPKSKIILGIFRAS